MNAVHEPTNAGNSSDDPMGGRTSLDVDGRRILVVDDSEHIRADFVKILGAPVTQSDPELEQVSRSLFGSDVPDHNQDQDRFFVETATQGQEGLGKVQRATDRGRPYSLAFVDMRMPPGWNGVETVAELWKVDPQLQIVICTAYSDFSWAEVLHTLGDTGRLHLLRKPFEPDQVRKIAAALCSKWVRLRSP